LLDLLASFYSHNNLFKSLLDSDCKEQTSRNKKTCQLAIFLFNKFHYFGSGMGCGSGVGTGCGSGVGTG
jgi:hypothetical protein